MKCLRRRVNLMTKGKYKKNLLDIIFVAKFFPILFLLGCVSIPISSANKEFFEYYPKVSENADTVLDLHSNIEKTTFYVNSQKLITGKRVKILIDSKSSYTIVAAPENYSPKEDFIQPPYMPNSVLSFTFLIGDKLDPHNVPQKKIEGIPVKGSEDRGKGEIAGGLSVDVDMQIPEGQKAGKYDVAVIIGNKNYSASGSPNVDFADRDARIMKEYLIKTFGYDPESIIYAEDAGFAKFNEIFGSERDHRGRLSNMVKDGVSKVFIYYVGHGAPDLETSEAYFVPVDANPQYIKTSGYRLQTFYNNLSKIPAKKITIVLDSCFSGSSEKGMLFKGISPAMVKVKKEYQGPSNAVIITSAAVDQVSVWYPEKRHSLFTYYFLKGLQGDADANKDGKITIGEMKEYLKEHVPYMARRLSGTEQQPVVTGNDSEVIVALKK